MDQEQREEHLICAGTMAGTCLTLINQALPKCKRVVAAYKKEHLELWFIHDCCNSIQQVGNYPIFEMSTDEIHASLEEFHEIILNALRFKATEEALMTNNINAETVH